MSSWFSGILRSIAGSLIMSLLPTAVGVDKFRSVNRFRIFASVMVTLLAALTAGTIMSTASAKAPPMSLSAPVNGKSSLLLNSSIPLDHAGFEWKITVRVKTPSGKVIRTTGRSLPHAGSIRRGDRRRSFRFVHEVPLSRAATRVLLKSKAADRKVSVSYSHDGPTGLEGGEESNGGYIPFRKVRRAGAGFCASAPMLRLTASEGKRVRRTLPGCGSRLKWKVGKGPDQGEVMIRGRKFSFTQEENQSGDDEFELIGRSKGRVMARQKVQLRVSPAPAESISVRAMGDSVTAGFGYYGATGKPMTFSQLFSCQPAAVSFNDACSSNSSNRNSSVGKTPVYLPDFGLSRNISWAAQWANTYGITDYRNYAVTGSTPSDWLPGGQFDATRQAIQQQNPDYIVMTMGANPILHDVLFGLDPMGCALEADLFGDYRACVLEAFEKVDLDGTLNQLYTELINNTESRIVLMQYHLSIPAAAPLYTSQQIEMMQILMNEIIEDEANKVSPERINVVAPPRFNVGIDMTPLYPAKYSCSWLDFKVDGPSVQATPSQDFLEGLHPLSFCPGPPDGPPWVISGDTGIHPSAAGYAQMASQIPAPE